MPPPYLSFLSVLCFIFLSCIFPSHYSSLSPFNFPSLCSCFPSIFLVSCSSCHLHLYFLLLFPSLHPFFTLSLLSSLLLFHLSIFLYLPSSALGSSPSSLPSFLPCFISLPSLHPQGSRALNWKTPQADKGKVTGGKKTRRRRKKRMRRREGRTKNPSGRERELRWNNGDRYVRVELSAVSH